MPQRSESDLFLTSFAVIPTGGFLIYLLRSSSKVLESVIVYVQEAVEYMRICESGGFRMCKKRWSTYDLAGLTVCACASGGGVHAP